MPVEKRANEWSILRTVYDIEECTAVEESERPDFLLTKHGHGAVPFGVEVTELFRDQADARSVRHPDYLDALFRGAPHMHKDDKAALPLSFMRITAAPRWVVGFEVILGAYSPLSMAARSSLSLVS